MNNLNSDKLSVVSTSSGKLSSKSPSISHTPRRHQPYPAPSSTISRAVIVHVPSRQRPCLAPISERDIHGKILDDALSVMEWHVPEWGKKDSLDATNKMLEAEVFIHKMRLMLEHIHEPVNLLTVFSHTMQSVNLENVILAITPLKKSDKHSAKQARHKFRYHLCKFFKMIDGAYVLDLPSKSPGKFGDVGDKLSKKFGEVINQINAVDLNQGL